MKNRHWLEDHSYLFIYISALLCIVRKVLCYSYLRDIHPTLCAKQKTRLFKRPRRTFKIYKKNKAGVCALSSPIVELCGNSHSRCGTRVFAAYKYQEENSEFNDTKNDYQSLPMTKVKPVYVCLLFTEITTFDNKSAKTLAVCTRVADSIVQHAEVISSLRNSMLLFLFTHCG